MSPGAPSSTGLIEFRPGAEIFPPKLWSNFSQPLPLVTPLYSIARRSSGGELRGAPLSVDLLG
jgi:hypothetical protein